LLRPVNNLGETIPDLTSPCDPRLFGLEKSDHCTEVKLDCICSLQCLTPDLVNRVTVTEIRANP
jgi:spore coat protein Y